MKKIIISIFILMLITVGCSTKQQIAGVDASELSKAYIYNDCVVKKEWLNLDYDYNFCRNNGKINDIPTDFFLLVYSNSKEFCKDKEANGCLCEFQLQCAPPNDFGWVIHGLWGEDEDAYKKNKNNKHPRFCKGDLPPLDIELLMPYLCMSPGTRLLQGEWEKHGACDFDTAEDYFNKMQELFNHFNAPPKDMGVKEAVQWMKENNPELKDIELSPMNNEFGICLTTDFEVMSCPEKDK